VSSSDELDSLLEGADWAFWAWMPYWCMRPASRPCRFDWIFRVLATAPHTGGIRGIEAIVKVVRIMPTLVVIVVLFAA
jgi:hypothetical protein